MLYVIGGLVVVVALIGAGVFFFMRQRQSSVEQRLGQFTGGQTVAPTDQATGSQKGSFVGDQLNTALTKRGFGENIAKELAQADIKLNVGEYMALHIIVGFGAAVGGWFAFGATFDLIALVGGVGIGVVAGMFGPRNYVNFQKGARLKKFDDQLGDMLNLVVNGLRAGYSVMQALESVSKELPAPISAEFKRVVQEMQLGLPMEGALANLLRRIPSKDLDFVVTAINVQREVGGNLAEILDSISFTIRERVRIKGEIATLTAQGMMTGYVISFLPIGLGLFLFMANREYMMQLFEPRSNLPCGLGMIATVLIMIGIGFTIIMKIVDIEV